MYKAVSLGSIIASSKRNESSGIIWLTLHQPSETEDGAFCPAMDVTVYSEHAITILRDFCDELLKDMKPKV